MTLPQKLPVISWPLVRRRWFSAGTPIHSRSTLPSSPPYTMISHLTQTGLYSMCDVTFHCGVAKHSASLLPSILSISGLSSAVAEIQAVYEGPEPVVKCLPDGVLQLDHAVYLVATSAWESKASCLYRSSPTTNFVCLESVTRTWWPMLRRRLG